MQYTTKPEPDAMYDTEQSREEFAVPPLLILSPKLFKDVQDVFAGGKAMA